MTTWMNTLIISLERFLMSNFYLVFSLCFGFETVSQHHICNRLTPTSPCNQRLSGSSCLYYLSAGITGVHYTSLFSLPSFRGCGSFHQILHRWADWLVIKKLNFVSCNFVAVVWLFVVLLHWLELAAVWCYREVVEGVNIFILPFYKEKQLVFHG